MVDKKTLRKVYLEKRLTLTEREYKIRNQLIAEKFLKNIDLTGINVIHSFLPIVKQKEVDTNLLIEQIKASNSHVAFAISKVVPPRSLRHFKFSDETKIETNNWGIPEPVAGEEISDKEIDLTFVPLVVFDKMGHRIGYGGGYYDRFLGGINKNVLKIGLSLSPPLDVIHYVENFDIPLDCCITPYKYYDFGNKE